MCWYEYLIIFKDPDRRKFNVFIGASFLANIMKDRHYYWILKKDWDECGPRVLDKIKEKLT
jgi:actin-related protein 2